MLNESKVTEWMKNIAKDYPDLVVLPAKGGIEIKYTALADQEESAVLVGNYTFAAVASGEISERDVREDCDAFFSSLKKE